MSKQPSVKGNTRVDCTAGNFSIGVLLVAARKNKEAMKDSVVTAEVFFLVSIRFRIQIRDLVSSCAVFFGLERKLWGMLFMLLAKIFK